MHDGFEVGGEDADRPLRLFREATPEPIREVRLLSAPLAESVPWPGEIAAHMDIGHSQPTAARDKPARTPRVDITEIERAIDLRRLRYFVQIVTEGSFSNAAQRVRVAQPALSHHVRELERILGVSLLTRSAHGVVPTKAGQCLYDHGVTILGRVRDAAIEVGEFGADTHRRVIIGLESSVAAILAVPLIEQIRLRAPDVQLVIEEGGPEGLRQLLESKSLDLALLYDVSEKRVLARQILLTEALCLVGSPDGSSAEITFEDAARLPLIMPKRPSRIRERFEAQGHLARIPLNIVTEIDSISSIKKLARAGLGYAVMSASECADEHRMGLIEKRMIVAPSFEQTLSLCHLTGSRLSGSAAQVRRIALQAVEKLVCQNMWPGAVPDQLRGPIVRRAAFA